MVIAYDGTSYHGWQYQPGLPTVEGSLVRALAPLTQAEVTLCAAGRTDAGAHARGQVANFHTPSSIDLDRLRRAVNRRLPPDIAVRAVDPVGEEFHATRDALGKHYRYTLWADREKPSYWQVPYVYHWYRPLDLDAVVRSARHLLGRHDFRSFESSSNQPRASTVRTVQRLEVRFHGPTVWFDVEGDGFLYRMVRNIVGTLLDVGRGRRRAEEIPDILNARDRTAAGPTVPAHGLTLVRVRYPDELENHRASPGRDRP